MEAEKYKKLVRLYVPEPSFTEGEKYYLSEGQAHYLRNVMRKSTGDQLRIFNGRDGEFLAEIEEINKKNAMVKLVKKTLEQKSSADIIILASPIKKEAFDLMVEKACELGAAKFIPVICDHTIVHKINQERLQAIAIEAAEQSERLDVMTVEPLIGLKNCLNSFESNRNLMFCIERDSGAVPIAKAALKPPEYARGVHGYSRAILIGPEGGFSAQELDSIANLKYVTPVSLGARIPRAETALISALSIVQAMDESTLT